MENYTLIKVDKYKILETYFKLNVDFETEKKKSIRSTLAHIADKQFLEFGYNQSVEFFISFEKGSLKAKVTFFGKIIIQGIMLYGGVSEGIDQIYKHSRLISERVIEVSRQENIDIDENLIRTEKRTGLIGRLKRTLDRIEYLQNNLNNLGNNQVQIELDSLQQDLANILAILSQEEHDAIINSLPQNVTNNLPQPNEDVEHMYNLYALKPEDIQLENE